MDDPIRIPLKACADLAGLFPALPAPAFCCKGGAG